MFLKPKQKMERMISDKIGARWRSIEGEERRLILSFQWGIEGIQAINQIDS